MIYGALEAGGTKMVCAIGDENGKILDSVKRVPLDVSSVRQVLPGMQYETPRTEGKSDPRVIVKENFIGELLTTSGTVAKVISGGLNGIAYVTANDRIKTQYAILEQKLAETEKAYKKVADYKPKYDDAKLTIKQLRKQVSQLEKKEKTLTAKNQKLKSDLDRYNANKQKESAHNSARIEKLKNKVDSLENLFKEYKRRGLSAVLESDLI